jgi:hypothetical protein
MAALARLADAPDPALRLLRDRLRPAVAPSADDLRRLIADLDAPRFASREAAQKRLAELGELAEAALWSALVDWPSAERRHRIVGLLEGSRLVRSADVRRQLRAVRLLESVGNDEARRLLEAMTKGAPSARATAEATTALGRLKRRR